MYSYHNTLSRPGQTPAIKSYPTYYQHLMNKKRGFQYSIITAIIDEDNFRS